MEDTLEVSRSDWGKTSWKPADETDLYEMIKELAGARLWGTSSYSFLAGVMPSIGSLESLGLTLAPWTLVLIEPETKCHCN